MNAAKKRKAKRPTTNMDRAVDRLYKAVDFYVRARGGSILVIGGIQVQEWPGDALGKFTVGVKCLGRKPELNVEGNPQ